ncbi:MAG: RluA family pseudouridine synthase [Verrucomicrobiota bacterium]|nr:RluA family pseudouridine synthase [Verrucomicrobiota bacterium]
MRSRILAAMRFAVEKNHARERLDQFLVMQLPALSRSRIAQLIKDGAALLNGEQTRPSARLKTDDVIDFTEPPPIVSDNQPEQIALDILFEDSDIIVLNKPAGMVVHPAAGNREHTLVNALLYHCRELSGIGGEQRPGIVHRLDKETSGCLVVAKNDLAHNKVSAQFAGREILKIYLAVVTGRLKAKTGVIEAPIGRHRVHRQKMAVVPDSGRAAKTSYRVVRELEGGLSLVECQLHTGRTHQIRVHLKHLGNPIAGDAVYGSRGGFSRQMLHAWKLGFFHPADAKWMEFVARLPDDFPRLEPSIS